MRFYSFLDRIAADTYPEPITPGHERITEQMFERIRPGLPAGASILDVGMGQGPAMKLFKRFGFKPLGISTNPTDFMTCRKDGLEVLLVDQNKMPMRDNDWDLIWARHVLEHSVAPYFTLTEFFRVCKPGGLLYVEVPAPDTSCHHEENKNHYSCLTRSTWNSLIPRAGWEIIEATELALTTGAGPDTYWTFTCRKPKQ